jgi:hypothetical protein
MRALKEYEIFAENPPTPLKKGKRRDFKMKTRRDLKKGKGKFQII